MFKIRINKFIAAHGAMSRRSADALLRAGKVTVNGQLVNVGTKIDPSIDVVTVNGIGIQLVKKRVYYALYKPVGYVSSTRDPQGRPCAVDLVPPKPRVYPVGRLDVDSEGLLLLTNDGDFTYRLTHPKHEVKKTYEVLVKGTLNEKELQWLREGVRLAEGQTRPATVVYLRQDHENTWLEMTIHEGHKRQIRRMLAVLGRETLRLIRTKEDRFTLEGLKPGEYKVIRDEQNS